MLKNIVGFKIKWKKFKDKILKHIGKQIKIDNEYDRLIKEKSNKSKSIDKIKK